MPAKTKKFSQNKNYEELLPPTLGDEPEQTSEADEGPQGAAEIALDEIKDNPFQFRRDITPQSVNELAKSMRQHGLIEPILLRPHQGGGYEVVAGARRVAAARQLNWGAIPAQVRDLNDADTAFIMAVENMQREGFTLADEAQMYERLGKLLGAANEELSARKLAEKLGVDYNRITRVRRLARFPGYLADVEDGRLTFRAALERITVEEGRARLVDMTPDQKRDLQPPSPDLRQLQEKLDNEFAARVAAAAPPAAPDAPLFSAEGVQQGAAAIAGNGWQALIRATNIIAALWNKEENVDPSALDKVARKDLISRCKDAQQQLSVLVKVLEAE